MITVSLCMIVKNEEKVIGRCLDSVRHLVDEINIVDTGSTDSTVEIVSKYTDRVFHFDWIDDFAAARNYAFQQATKDYILWLDADDVMESIDQDRFLELKRTLLPDIDAVSMAYNLAMTEDGLVKSSIRRYRLVKRSCQFKWIGAVHEFLAIGGNLFDSHVAVTHLPIEHDLNRNIQIYQKKLARGDSFTPRDLFYFANELHDHQQYEHAIEYYLKFLATKEGWVEEYISACIKLASCYSCLGNEEKRIDWMLQSFKYGIPRSEVCCAIGDHFLDKQLYEAAIHWYLFAIRKENDRAFFRNQDCETWIPRLLLCVCYDRLGQYELANHYNEEAMKYHHTHPSMLYNKEYLEGRLAKKRQQLVTL